MNATHPGPALSHKERRQHFCRPISLFLSLCRVAAYLFEYPFTAVIGLPTHTFTEFNAATNPSLETASEKTSHPL